MFLKKTIIKAGYEEQFNLPHFTNEDLDDYLESEFELDEELEDYLDGEEVEDEECECPLCEMEGDVADLKKLVIMLLDYLDVELLYTPGVDSKLELIKRPIEVAPKKVAPKKVVKKVAKKRK